MSIGQYGVICRKFSTLPQKQSDQIPTRDIHMKPKSLISTVFRFWAAMTAMALMPIAAIAQSYPTRPVNIVLAYPAGSVSDVLARNLAQRLSAQWKQAVVVDNRPGGNQIIATNIVAKAAPDGYTLLLCDDGAFTLNPHLFSKLPYSLSDFSPVIDLAELQMVMSVAKEVPARSLSELVAHAKANPDKLNYGSFGIGNIVHLSMDSFAKMASVKLVHVPYKGYPDAIRDALANQVQVILGGVGGPVLHHLKSGALVPLAVTGRTRSPLLPNVPTFAESGYANFKPEVNFVLMAPAGTPTAIVRQINIDAAKILHEIAPTVLEPNGMKLLAHSPLELAQSIETGRLSYAEWVKSAGVKLD